MWLKFGIFGVLHSLKPSLITKNMFEVILAEVFLLLGDIMKLCTAKLVGARFTVCLETVHSRIFTAWSETVATTPVSKNLGNDTSQCCSKPTFLAIKTRQDLAASWLFFASQTWLDYWTCQGPLSQSLKVKEVKKSRRRMTRHKFTSLCKNFSSMWALMTFKVHSWKKILYSKLWGAFNSCTVAFEKTTRYSSGDSVCVVGRW